MPPRDPRPLHERVLARLANTDQPDECWLWQGRSVLTSGHAVLTSQRRQYRAHVVMYEWAHGPVPPGKQVNHECGNARCGNPAHLYAGTPKENSADAIRHGTHRVPPAEVNAAKTHCVAGHPLSGDNLYRPPNSTERVCRECKRRQWREWHDRQKS